MLVSDDCILDQSSKGYHLERIGIRSWDDTAKWAQENGGRLLTEEEVRSIITKTAIEEGADGVNVPYDEAQWLLREFDEMLDPKLEVWDPVLQKYQKVELEGGFFNEIITEGGKLNQV